ncbi:hypothetical protein SNK03_001685 [Fusarium graminearum]|uniref:Chromosome 1, complete genome n=1 Tax=Gibberella zeae (strain ATCC MYA-4620 / CBS 123657 / FGSC 9075 / NRRL 31084 / PH-1) TaxID=229533 RepID=I1RCY8_GIBZE|nr:hypothetical protein FGSG_01474 [Fusarium graminearum PH-1]ESU06796.1 hypothetical protein FGSG_01474 [Fusarium graminearum PH-1]CEF73614.1 unnamed protein product [Fusarium graminearum]CZS76883.1 unnamed protein product [Fusarium graminearum]|eukprot:XP_011317281.1 hypothetical protein FGSG_01474 [Fusarium graminearum PH-1]
MWYSNGKKAQNHAHAMSTADIGLATHTKELDFRVGAQASRSPARYEGRPYVLGELLIKHDPAVALIQPDKGSSEAWWYKPAVIHKDFRQGPETFADPKDGAPWCRCNPPA